MIPLRDERVVLVGLNSTVIAGVNSRRYRLTVYPVSSNPVYVRSAQKATLSGGAAVQLGTTPIVFGDGETGRAFDQQINAIAAVDQTPVMVVDEFWG